MAAITQGFKPMFKGFVTDSVKEINKKRKVIDIIIHPTSIPCGDKTATVDKAQFDKMMLDFQKKIA